jgi:hypothetical protein
MQPSDGKVHEIPIDRIRQNTAMVTRGFFVLLFYPGFGVLTLMLPIIRDLPHIDPQKIGNPVLWLAVALAVTFLIINRKWGTRFTSACLWAMIGSLVLLLLGGGVWLWGLTPRDFSPETLRDFSVADMAALALLTLLAGLLAWWLFIVPIWAAIRLLGTRIQPGDIALPDVMAARAQRDDERAEGPRGFSVCCGNTVRRFDLGASPRVGGRRAVAVRQRRQTDRSHTGIRCDLRGHHAVAP